MLIWGGWGGEGVTVYFVSVLAFTVSQPVAVLDYMFS